MSKKTPNKHISMIWDNFRLSPMLLMVMENKKDRQYYFKRSRQSSNNTFNLKKLRTWFSLFFRKENVQMLDLHLVFLSGSFVCKVPE